MEFLPASSLARGPEPPNLKGDACRHLGASLHFLRCIGIAPVTPARSTGGWRKLQSAALQDPSPRFGVPQRGLGYVDTTAGNAFYPWSCAGSCAGGIFWATLKRLQLCLRDTGASAESAERSRQHQHGRTGHYPAPANDTALHSCAGRPAELHHAAAKHHRSPRSQGGIRGC